MKHVFTPIQTIYHLKPNNFHGLLKNSYRRLSSTNEAKSLKRNIILALLFEYWRRRLPETPFLDLFRLFIILAVF